MLNEYLEFLNKVKNDNNLTLLELSQLLEIPYTTLLGQYYYNKKPPKWVQDLIICNYESKIKKPE